MALIRIGKTAIIFPPSAENAGNITIDSLDFLEGDKRTEVPDMAVMGYIEKMPEEAKNLRKWENAFRIIEFSSEENQKKFEYFLEGQEPKSKAPKQFIPKKSTKKAVDDARLRAEKNKHEPGDVLDVTTAEAHDVLSLRAKAGDLKFLKEVKGLLDIYKDPDLEKYLDNLIDNVENKAIHDDDMNEESLLGKGIRTLVKTASEMGIRNPEKYNKDELVDRILKKFHGKQAQQRRA